MRIYLDHNATTPLRPAAREAMVAVLDGVFGNPSSTHADGAAARRVVEDAREQVASLVGAAPREVTFTAGATEANNTVLASLRDGSLPWRRLVTTRAEHPSVREPALALARAGLDVAWLDVDRDGRLDLAQLDAALAAGPPALVSVIAANNETGVVAPIDAIAERVRAAGAFLHTDVTQALGKIPVRALAAGAHWLSASAHKLGGPKGTGCLVAREGLGLPALLQGGPQERRARGGTENVAGIAGFGAACAEAERALPERALRDAALRDRLWSGLRARLERIAWNGAPDGDGRAPAAHALLPNTLSLEIEGAAADVLLEALDLEGIAVSTGAACHSGAIEPSHVLLAMGRSPERARSTLRLSVGEGNDEAQIDRAIATIAALAARARAALGGELGAAPGGARARAAGARA
ncbi:MAG: cysteine desulfurase family protein [Myxococcota bacterium]